jgi:hypothetical protein
MVTAAPGYDAYAPQYTAQPGYDPYAQVPAPPAYVPQPPPEPEAEADVQEVEVLDEDTGER